jgi:hydroxyacylglutathione hydrolase
MNERARVLPLDVWWPASHGDVGVYLVQGEKTALIDTAGPGAELLEALGKVGVAPADIDLVLNTHGHPDHTAGNATLKQNGHPEICIHEEDALYLEDHAAAFDRFHAPVTTAFLGPEAVAAEKAGFVQGLGPDMAVDRRLRDGDSLDLGKGVKIHVVHLPGHTLGSVGFLLEEEGVLIAGDSMPGAGTPDGCLPLIIDIPAYRESLERLTGLPIQTLHTTHPFRGIHTGPATVREGAEVQEYLRESAEFVDLLWSAMEWQAGLACDRSMGELADDLIDALPAELGLKRITEIFLPGMAMSTIFWNCQKLTGA